MHTNRPINISIMEFRSVTCVRSHKLNETVVIYASFRKPGFASRFSYFREGKDGNNHSNIHQRNATPHGRCLLQSYVHTHSVLTAIFPGEPGLAGCPLNSPSPFIPELCILLGQA